MRHLDEEAGTDNSDLLHFRRRDSEVGDSGNSADETGVPQKDEPTKQHPRNKKPAQVEEPDSRRNSTPGEKSRNSTTRNTTGLTHRNSWARPGEMMRRNSVL